MDRTDQHHEQEHGMFANTKAFSGFAVEGLGQDEKGINRAGGPYIAWFKDPAGNILAVLQER
jgi:hypothetical protein